MTRCPTLAELPPPPPGKRGWPWTTASPPSPPNRPDGADWPRISVITPSYNQGAFIEETLRSVLLQGYPNLEYIVLDGGSEDGSVAIVEKYAPWLSHWRSERDGGQACAINRGMARATGDVFNWINSDDILASGALAQIGRLYAPDIDVIAGPVINFSAEGTERVENCGIGWRSLISGRNMSFHQPGVWLTLDRARQVGLFPLHLNYRFDAAYLIRFLYFFDRIVSTSEPLVYFRVHQRSKTSAVARTGITEDLKMQRYLRDRGSPRAIRAYSRRVTRGWAFHRAMRRIARSERGALGKIAVALRIAPWRWLGSRFLLGFLRRELMKVGIASGPERGS